MTQHTHRNPTLHLSGGRCFQKKEGDIKVFLFVLICLAGETFNVTIERSAPGMGVVTVDWSIESPLGLDPALSFRQTNGQITFIEVRDCSPYNPLVKVFLISEVDNCTLNTHIHDR